MKTFATLAAGITFAFVSCGPENAATSVNTNQSASIKASEIITLSNWISLYDDGTDFTYSSTVTWPVITQDMRDRGLVMAYLKNTTTQAWQALPYSYAADGYSDAINFDVNTGLVNITYDGYDLSGSPGASSVNGYFTIRLVAVPASARMANPDIDWTNYEEVAALLDKKQ